MGGLPRPPSGGSAQTPVCYVHFISINAVSFSHCADQGHVLLQQFFSERIASEVIVCCNITPGSSVRLHKLRDHGLSNILGGIVTLLFTYVCRQVADVSILSITAKPPLQATLGGLGWYILSEISASLVWNQLFIYGQAWPWRVRVLQSSCEHIEQFPEWC